MVCVKCDQQILTGQQYERAKTGVRHRFCPLLTGDEFHDRFVQNYSLMPLHVYHANLQAWETDSAFRKLCIHCGNGCLLLMRDKDHFFLLATDHCVSCGRRYIYMDIVQLRKFDKGEAPYPDRR